MKVVAKCDFYA